MLYLRYIDYIFNIWKVLKKLNKQHPTAKFDLKISKEEIAFLDTKIYIDGDKNIQTTI